MAGFCDLVMVLREAEERERKCNDSSSSQCRASGRVGCACVKLPLSSRRSRRVPVAGALGARRSVWWWSGARGLLCAANDVSPEMTSLEIFPGYEIPSYCQNGHRRRQLSAHITRYGKFCLAGVVEVDEGCVGGMLRGSRRALLRTLLSGHNLLKGIEEEENSLT